MSVTWSPTARITYYQVLEYLDEKWTVKEIEAFINRTEEVINYICDNPYFTFIPKKAIRINVL